jgi:SWI/SNF-related matrix-associated actin-dependent regulator 1 of chromatin subfamily A
MAEREEIQEELRQYLKKSSAGNGSRNKKWQKHLEGGSTISLDVILAPVTYFQKEKSDDRKFLNKFQYDYLVVDEAHMLKNSQSTRYKMLDKAKTLHRLLLTGTPVQNSPQELLNMLCFLMPLFGKGGGSTPFDDSESQQNVEERMLQHFVEHEKIDGRDDQQAYQKLKHLFAPFVLRRKKSDVISQLLPPKEHVLENVNLDPSARNIYDQILASHVNKNGDKVTAAIGDHLFTNLRKAAHHPLLLRTRHNSPSQISHMVEHFHKYGAFKGEGSTRARVREELTKFNDFHIHLTAHDLIDENPHRRADLERYILPEDALYSSAKFCRLQTLLPNLIHKDHRILIFSAWTSCLDLLGCLMEHLNLQYLRMDGSTPSAERQELIDHFNSESDIKVFLLSTKACGLGINLTAADTCIIHDLDFNPFNDLQAEGKLCCFSRFLLLYLPHLKASVVDSDRCHRIGQKKPVTVYKMITNDTVDADIYMMQERKSKMNAAIMESGSSAKSSDKKIRKEMLQSAVERFLGSPKLSLKRASSDGKQSNKENKEVVDVIRGKENMG